MILKHTHTHKNNKATQGLNLSLDKHGWIQKINYFLIGLNGTFADTFILLRIFLKTIPNAMHQGKSGGRSLLGLNPKSAHDN